MSLDANGSISTSHDRFPPFPTNLKTAPLVSISLAKLEDKDNSESLAFFNASRNLGFFYLDLKDSQLGRAIIRDAEQLCTIQQEFYSQPQSEKTLYAREKIDPFFGYRQVKLPVLGSDGNPLLVETYNLRKDDFVGNREPLPCHSLVTQNWEVFQSYTQACHQVVQLMLMLYEKHLEIPEGTLLGVHRLNEHSGDHIRFNRAASIPYSEALARAGEHTDFGSLTILMNWLGGLQIRLPATNEWVYVKPVPGSAIINLGDALVKFTAGILRSNVHRVVPPPAPQNKIVRDSLVYFARPEDKTILKRLKGGIIDLCPHTLSEKEEPEITAYDWILRRSVGDLKGIYTVKHGLESRVLQSDKIPS